MKMNGFFIRLALFPVLLAAMSGCGDNISPGAYAVSTLAASEPCMGCHGAAVSKVTGAVIADEWKLSRHNTETAGKNVPGYGAGCRDCHEPEAGHPNSCGRCHGGTSSSVVSRHDVVLNPDTALKCGKCHTEKTQKTPHFNSYTAVTHDAQYVDLQNTGKCRNCHNPHNNAILPEARDWAKSGHGDVKGKAWSTRDFKSNANCLRCHTATGYVNYATSAFTLATSSLAASETYGVLGCNACHTGYNFKQSVRQVPQFTAPYNGGLSPKTFPDAGQSNICIPCHAGRESGDSIKDSASDFSNTSFKNSHYLTAGGIVFSKSGYHYGNRNYDSNIKNDGTANGFRHDDLGVGPTGIAAADAYISANNLNSAGPCVVCHLTSEKLGVKTSHRLSPFTEYAAGDDALNPVCVTCHSKRGARSNAKVEWFEGQWKVRINAALDALKDQLALKGIYNNASHPYFYKDPNGDGTLSADEVKRANGYKTWELPYGAGTGKNTMGAAFNYNLLAHDPGAVAHNRFYSRRLIYDAIDWLDDGMVNYSVFTTLNALGSDKTYKADAITFLINRGAEDVNIGTEKERY
jgi:hypothetical protein